MAINTTRHYADGVRAGKRIKRGESVWTPEQARKWADSELDRLADALPAPHPSAVAYMRGLLKGVGKA